MLKIRDNQYLKFKKYISANGSTSASRLATSMVAPMDVEDADEDYPPNYPMAKGEESWLYTRQKKLRPTVTLSIHHSGQHSNLI